MLNNDTTLTSTILDEVSNLGNSHVHKIALSWMKEYTVAASDSYKPEYERNASRAIDSIFVSDSALHKMGLLFLMRPESDCSYILQRYGEPIFTETDGNGITRNIYASEGNFVVVCTSKDCFLDGFISFEKLSGSTEMSDDTKQNLAIEIARSIKFESTN